MENSNKLVFFPEADDDLQAILQGDKKLLIRRVHCYTLLSDGIILHPAYIWQSKTTNELVLRYISEVLTPSIFKILLGDSATIKEYITERMEKVSPKKVGETLYEYHQYKRWGSDITDQASKLDKAFLGREPVILAESRDAKFRRLLTNDVAENLDPYSLYWMLSEFIRKEKVNIDVVTLISKLQNYIKSADLVSVESLTNYVTRDIGLQPLSQSIDFKKRMLDIYYHSNVDERIHVPGLTVISNRIVDPFDVDIFWKVFAGLFGKKAAVALSEGSDPRMTKTILEIRDSSVWQDFRRIYFSVLEEIESSLWHNTSLVQGRIEDATGYSSVTVIKRIWREKRLETVAIVFGIICCATTPVSISLLPIGIASIMLSAASLRKAMDRFIHEYHKNDLTTLRYRIGKVVEDVVENSLKSQP